MLDVRLLGKFEVKRDGKLVTISSRPAQSLFAYLILNAGTLHRREKLAGLLWQESTEEGARDYLRHALWKIRKAVEPASTKMKSDLYIIADDINVAFNPKSKYSLDTVTIKNIGENDPIQEWMNALLLYTGELLPGFYDEWVVLEREHLLAVFENKMAHLLALLQDEHRWLDMLDCAERWISLGQKPEPAYRALMSAHAALGDMSKVASTFERCEKSLKEFGFEPSDQTRLLYEDLRSGKDNLKSGSSISKVGSKPMPSDLPSGTVTFLFTDIEDSTKVAQEHPDIWEALRERHRAILQAAVETNNGYIFQIIGDACCAAFQTTSDALKAALEGQRKLQNDSWDGVPIKVRMGVHTGEAQDHDGEYTGYLTLTRVQRVMSTAFGGQILLSNASAELVRGQLPDGVFLRDMQEHRLKGLLIPEHLWQATVPDLHQDFPALELLNTVPNNLPVQLTSFVGREREIAEVCKLLQTQRLVTLTGSGGTGKTRLSLHIASELLDTFKDGVWFVELAPLSDPALVPNAVASVMGVHEESNRALMATLLDWLGSKELLLILDNCEHLIEACTKFADAALHASQAVRILTSSREAFGMAGETKYHVPSLETPKPALALQIPVEELTEYTAVHLFVERATQALTEFAVTKTNAPAVAQICYRLDGIPLAIELAAARVKVLHVDQIAKRLDDRFHLLTGGSRIALPRHQTLRSSIDWSHSLLSEPEQVVLRRLSVFTGGWALEAAEQVCAGSGIETDDVLDLLTHLADKSLVVVDPVVRESRYHMLETIRQYAWEKLSESGEVEMIRDRHLDFMLTLMENAEPEMQKQDEIIWLDRLELELDNLRAALEWALRISNAEAGLRLAGAADWFWWTRGYSHEAEGWLRATLGKPGAEKGTKARAKALKAIGSILFTSGDFAEARVALDESVSIGRAIQDKRCLVDSLPWLGFAVSILGEVTAASLMLNESMELSHELGDKHGIALTLVGQGNLKLSEVNYHEALPLYEESAALLREIGDKNFLAYVVRRLGYVALRQANYHKALDLCIESLNLNTELGDQRGIGASLAAIACIASAQGHNMRAARLFGAAATVVVSLDGVLAPVDEIAHKPYLLTARGKIGEEKYNKAFSEGQAMKMNQTVAYAVEVEKE